MEKIDYEAPELIVLESPLVAMGESGCLDGPQNSERITTTNKPCPNGADD